MIDRRRQILVVDNDLQLRAEMLEHLAHEGFAVFGARDGASMDACLEREPIDLVVLELSLPGEHGLSICRRLCSQIGPGVIIASALAEEPDRVRGLDLGADDYLPKPFSHRELLARVRAVLRRKEGRAGGEQSAPFAFAGFSYDPVHRHLKAPSGPRIPLTTAESTLLVTLLMNPRRTMLREELPWSGQPESSNGTRAVDAQVSRLRRKLKTHGGGRLIGTQRGMGYQLNCDVMRA